MNNNVDSKNDDENPALRCLGWLVIVSPFILLGVALGLFLWFWGCK